MQNEKGSKLDRFFAGKGFYIVLGLCVLVIAVSAVSLVKTDNSAPGSLDPGMSAAQSTRPPAASVPPVSSDAPVDAAAPDEKDIVSAGTVESGEEWPAQNEWRWPVSGEIERGYTVEALAYDVTMSDWRTHDGVDIAATLGEVVVAAADGTVESVYNDDLYGTTVVISHSGGVKTIYSNLADTPTVAAGDTVKGGDVIGSVGKTAVCEIGQGTHLHFAATVDGKTADPMSLLPI